MRVYPHGFQQNKIWSFLHERERTLDDTYDHVPRRAPRGKVLSPLLHVLCSPLSTLTI